MINTATNNFNRSQSGISVTIGSLGLTSTSPTVTYNPAVLDIFGIALSTDLAGDGAAPNENWFPFQSLKGFCDQTGWPDGMCYGVTMTLSATVVMGLIAWATGSVFFAILAFCAVLIYGAVGRLYAPWYPLLLSILAVVIPLARKRLGHS